MSIDFSDYIEEHTLNFTGRDWIFNEINRWLEGSNDLESIAIIGEPGCGKTAIASRLVQFSEGVCSPSSGLESLKKDFLDAYHFCSIHDLRWINPIEFSKSISSQLALHSSFSEALLKNNLKQRKIKIIQKVKANNVEKIVGLVIENLPGMNPEDAFIQLVSDPLETIYRDGYPHKFIIMIDALDESIYYTGEIGIISLISKMMSSLPNVKLIMSSRIETDILRHLHRFKVPPIEISLSSGSGFDASMKDIEKFITGVLEEKQQIVNKLSKEVSPQYFISYLTEKSKGNFIYIKLTLDSMEYHTDKIDQGYIDRLPDGLDEIYLEYLERILPKAENLWEQKYGPILGIFSVCLEALTVEQISFFTGFGNSQVRWALKTIGQLLRIQKTASGEAFMYSIYHKSFSDFLTNRRLSEEFFCDPLLWNKNLGEVYFENYKGHWKECDTYGLKYCFYHLFQANEWKKIFILLTDLDFLTTKAKRIGTENLIEDLYNGYSYFYEKEKDKATSICSALFDFFIKMVVEKKAGGLSLLEIIHNSLFYRPITNLVEKFLKEGIQKLLSITEIHDQSVNLIFAFRQKYAELLRRIGDLIESENQLRRLLEEVQSSEIPQTLPQISSMKYNLGYILFLNGKFNDAIEMFHESADNAFKGKSDVKGWVSRCLEYRVRMLKEIWDSASHRDFPLEAIREFEVILNKGMKTFQEKSKSDPIAERWVMNVYSHLFEVSYYRKDCASAKKNFSLLEQDEWVRKYGEDVSKKVTKARLAIIDEDWETAAYLFEEYFKLISSNLEEWQRKEAFVWIYYDYGCSLLNIGKSERAIKIWKTAMTFPDNFGNQIWKKKIKEELRTLGVEV